MVYNVIKNQVKTRVPLADSTSLFCSVACPINRECWDRHKDRVRGMFPASTEVADKFKHLHGEAYMQVIQAHLSGREPYLTVMGGNIEDGELVANGQAPKDREGHTLAWPLVPLGVNPKKAN